MFFASPLKILHFFSGEVSPKFVAPGILAAKVEFLNISLTSLGRDCASVCSHMCDCQFVEAKE